MEESPAPDYKRLFQEAPGLYLVLDSDLRIVAATDAYLEATLTRRESIIGQHIFDVFPDNPDDPGADSVRNSRASFTRVLQTRQPDTIGLQRHDVRRPDSEGGGFEVRYWSAVNYPLLNADGSLAYIMHKVENVTEFVQLKQQGVEQAKITDDLREQALKMEADLYARSREMASTSQKLKKANEELEGALRKLEAESEERMHAVNELRVREQLLIQQNRLAAMGEMLVNISHQWRQPLNTLGLILQKLAMSYRQGTFSGKMLDKSVSRGSELIEHMSRTIDDFSAYLNPDQDKASFDMLDVVKKAVTMAVESLRGVQVEVDHPPSPVTATGYRNQFVQVLINILMNARDALEEGATIDPMIAVKIFREDGKSVVTIADNAGGIPAQVMDRIFEPYFTTKAPGKGTGIGLFMSRTIIEKGMGGRLTARNTGDGAEFRIEV